MLSDYEIEAYLGIRETNFPDIFQVKAGVVALQDETPAGRQRAAAYMPYAYFQVFGYYTYVFNGMSVPDAIPKTRDFALASFQYCRIMPERDPPDVAPPPTRLLLSYEDGRAVFTEGEGEKGKVLEFEGVIYEVALGSSEHRVVVPQEVESWAKAVYSPQVWVERDMTDMTVYQTESYGDIAAEHRETVRELLSTIPEDVHLIVPGDGEGLVAALWTGRGTYGDPVVTARTHPLVKKEVAEETVTRGRQEAGANKTLLLGVYISAFYSTPPQDLPSLWIDHDKILDRIKGLHRLSEALYSLGYETTCRSSLDRWGRKRWKPYHMPYTERARAQRMLSFPHLSRAALEVLRNTDLVAFVPSAVYTFVRGIGATIVPYGPQEPLRAPPEDVPVFSVSVVDMLGSKRAYFVPFGRVLSLEDAVCHTAKKGVLVARTLYYVPDEMEYLIPLRAWRERIWDQIYFGIPEEVPMAYVRYRSGSSYLVLQYKVLPYQSDVGWSPDRAWDQIGSYDSPAEIVSQLRDLGVDDPTLVTAMVSTVAELVAGPDIVDILRGGPKTFKELYEQGAFSRKGISRGTLRKVLRSSRRWVESGGRWELVVE